MREKARERRLPTLGGALVALGTIVVFIAVGMMVFGVQLQTMMLFSWLLIAFYAWRLGIPFAELESKAYDSVRAALPACMILFGTGTLVASWISAGTVSTLIYAGLKVCTPRFFLLIAFFLSTVVALATGTSWGTLGTIGLAMMGVGAGLAMPAGMTAGAVICGAFFGDKLSPVSDSTNMAAAVSGTPLMSHVRSMLYTTVPAYGLTTIIFLFIGLTRGEGSMDTGIIEEMLTAISGSMRVSWVTLLPAALFLILLIRRTSALLSILISSVAGFLLAVAFQGGGIAQSAQALYHGVTQDFGSELVNTLLHRGGIVSMLGTVSLTIIALSLGGMLQASGILQVIVNALAKKITKVPGLILATMASSYFGNIVVGSNSFAMITTATLLKPLYKKFKIKANVLSRVLEDCGTLGAPLIPWNVNAVYSIEMLQVPWSAYAPYCFLNYLTPVVSIIYAFIGFAIFPDDEPEEAGEALPAAEGVAQG